MKSSYTARVVWLLSMVTLLSATAGPIKGYQWHHAFEIPGIDDDASGITWSPVTDHLYVIIDGPERVVELTRDGEALRQIKLKGFEDTEGITHIDGHTFAIIEENEMAISFIDLSPDVLSVSAKDKHPTIRIDQPLPKEDASGLEGISYDAANDVLYVVKEAEPKVVFKITQARKETPVLAKDAALLQAVNDLEDLSDIYFSFAEGCLYVVSDRSKAFVRMQLDGSSAEHFSLKKGNLGLGKSIKDAEGITQDKEGRLYICSEPRNINVFVPIRD